ncbi:hypothetical protein MMC07_009659 [Pseudocyphellaria aurata]|nr:hypothetical protein [Pseudocyphellaria aurata]
MRETPWHPQQSRQPDHYGRGQPRGGQYRGRYLQPGHHRQGTYSSGRQGPSGGVGIHWRVGQDSRFDSYNGSNSDNDDDSYSHSHSNSGSYSESESDSDSNSLSSDDGVHQQTEPYRPAGRLTGPQPAHSVPDFHRVPNGQSASAFMDEGRGLGGSERLSRGVEDREVGSRRGIMQGGSPRNRHRRDLPPSYGESQQEGNPPSYDESQQQYNSP